MDRKMECPICKKKAVFVGVHDDEGNYHGLMGCDYEDAPWSGLSYALHHEGWGDCPLCTDGAESTMGGMLFDTAEEAITALSPPNEALTWEELKSEAKVNPVYSVKYGWIFPSTVKDEPYKQIWFFTSKGFAQTELFYRDTFYRRPPEGEADGK